MPESIGQSSLPSLKYLDMDKIKRETACFGHSPPITSAVNMAAPPLVSPSTVYSGPPPPYSGPSSASSSIVGGREVAPAPAAPQSYISPPESRQPSGDDKEAPLPQAPRQSLPSIHEALNGDQTMSISSLLSSSTAAQQKPSYTAPSPVSPVARSYIDPPPQRSSDPFAHSTPAIYRPYEPPEKSNRPPNSPQLAISYALNPPPAAPSHNSYSSVPPPRQIVSDSSYPRPGPPIIQRHRAASPFHDQSQVLRSTPTTNAQPSYNSYQPTTYAYPTATPAASSFRGPALQPPIYRGSNSDQARAEEVRKATAKESPVPRPAYGESVKRHLDIFDIETSLNEVAEGSGRALDFSRDFRLRAHHSQRSGPIAGSLPTLADCEAMIKQQSRVMDSLHRIKDVVIKQQQALEEQRSYDQQNYKIAPSEADDDGGAYMDKVEGGGGFAGAEAKKRRSRAAPPGRCHSCNRGETPEWRRGPDGARTLCNACGLHYAKLTRKMGSKAAAGPSNLRPKESETSSP